MQSVNGVTNKPRRPDPCERLACIARHPGQAGGVNAGIEASVTFAVKKHDDLSAVCDGRLGPDDGCYCYGREANPTTNYLGRQLAALDGTEAGYATSSGMSAIACSLLTLCDSGDHIIAGNTLYGGTFMLLSKFFPRKCGITTSFVDLDDDAAVQAAVRPNTKVLYAETLTNPTLSVPDLPQLAELAHSRGLKVVVDNTFASLVVSPALLGADVVVQSLTKYVSGAADIMAGSVCGSKAFVTRLMDVHSGAMMMLGPVLDPKIASELSLRLPSLAARVREHSRRALGFAECLQQAGLSVMYPGLKLHPHHTRLDSLRNEGGYGYGGMLTVDLHSYEGAVRFMESAQNDHGFGLIAVSLGYFDTLMCASASSTASHLSEEDLKAAGIQPGLVRISIGISGSYEQRLQQLQGAIRDGWRG